jgi:hypothetical protein
MTSLLLALAPTAKATTYPDLQYNVTLNLSSLDLLPNAPFSLDLQLVTGSAAPNITNTVTLSNFVFTGGTASGTPDYTNGNESGSLASSVVLTTGTTPSFHVDQTPNSELVSSGTPIPDQFNVSILDSNLNNVPTTDPSGAANDTYTLVSSAISSSETASNVNYYTLATPEPSSAALSFIAIGGMLGLVLLRRRLLA